MRDHFDITWRAGAYYVSIPNYRGGTVYTSESHDRLIREREALRETLETLEYASRKDSLTEHERLDSVRHVILRVLAALKDQA